MSAASFLHSSFLQEISDVMLWPVHEGGNVGYSH